MKAISILVMPLAGLLLSACAGGRLHGDVETLKQSVETVKAQCEASYQSPVLDGIRDKVELYKEPPDAPVSFAVAANNDRATPAEQALIRQWATLRDHCLEQLRAVQTIPASAPPEMAVFMETTYSLSHEFQAKVGDLIVALYQGKLSYSEFAEKRYEIGKATEDTLHEFQSQTIVADRQRQLEDEQIAQARFQRVLEGFDAYLAAVNRRPAVSMSSCTTMGNTVNCMQTRP